MPIEKRIAAREVRNGDMIYNSQATHPAFAWLAVKAVSRTGDGTVVIKTSVYETYKHPQEYVDVRRYPNADGATNGEG